MRETPANSPKKDNWLNRNVFAMGLTSLLGDAGHEMVTAILPFFKLQSACDFPLFSFSTLFCSLIHVQKALY